MNTLISGRRITEADLGWWHAIIPELDWVFAVTYAESAPHEYISERTEGMSAKDFVRAAHVIHTFGEPQKYYKSTRIYLVHDGWKYWTMAREHVSVRLINRGRADHVYGVQNMPRTASSFPSPYNEIASHWDGHYALTGEELEGFRGIIDRVTSGYRKYRTLDIGAGTGLSLDLGVTDSFRLTAVDPSQAMLNELVRKHPHIARVEPSTFAEVIRTRALAGTKFDLVLALGGSGSYLTDENWKDLRALGKGRYLLSVYAAGEHPPTQDLTDGALRDARERLNTMQQLHGGEVTQVGRFMVWSCDA